MNSDDPDDLKDPRDSAFVRLAAGIGDLGNPFYREERQRDVWNEASAVTAQVLLWGGLLAAAAMVWIGGGDGLPYALTLFLLLGVGSWVGVAYAARLGVRAANGTRMARARIVPTILLMVVFLAGVARAGAGL